MANIMSFFPFTLLKDRPMRPANREPRGNVDAFLEALSRAADRVENLHYRFGKEQNPDGFVQLWPSADHWIQIHRLWTRHPNRGDGSRILEALCALADQHDIGIRLKVLPIGRKPYPMTRSKLKEWYGRFGFEGRRWNVRRLPRVQARAAESSEAIVINSSSLTRAKLTLVACTISEVFSTKAQNNSIICAQFVRNA